MQCSSKETASGGLEQKGAQNRCSFSFSLFPALSLSLALSVFEHNLSLALLIVELWANTRLKTLHAHRSYDIERKQKEVIPRFFLIRFIHG